MSGKLSMFKKENICRSARDNSFHPAQNATIPVNPPPHLFIMTSLSLIQGSCSERHTDTGRQRVIPGSPFACHTLQCGSPMQSVSRLASVCDAASREMALVIDLEAKLRHARVLAMRQLKTQREKNTEKDLNSVYFLIFSLRDI